VVARGKGCGERRVGVAIKIHHVKANTNGK
jgi:hypothetical protein